MTFLFNIYTHLIKQIEIGLWLLHIIAVIIQFKCRPEGNKIGFSVLLEDIIYYWYAGRIFNEACREERKISGWGFFYFLNVLM